MIHSYRYINKHRQFDSTSYTLIIEARENDILINTYRIEKCFKINENLIDDEFLRAYAYKEIDRIILENQPIEQLSLVEESISEEIVENDPPPVGDEPGVI